MLGFPYWSFHTQQLPTLDIVCPVDKMLGCNTCCQWLHREVLWQYHTCTSYCIYYQGRLSHYVAGSCNSSHPLYDPGLAGNGIPLGLFQCGQDFCVAASYSLSNYLLTITVQSSDKMQLKICCFLGQLFNLCLCQLSLITIQK